MATDYFTKMMVFFTKNLTDDTYGMSVDREATGLNVDLLLQIMEKFYYYHSVNFSSENLELWDEAFQKLQKLRHNLVPYIWVEEDTRIENWIEELIEREGD